MISRRIAVLVLFACVADVAAQEGRTIPGWGMVIDPDGDCDIREDGGKLTIRVPGKAHDFAGELQRWNAPRVLRPVKGDFVLEVKVSGELKPSDTSTIETRRPYNGAGLMVMKDKNNHVSLHRGAVELNGMVRQYANFELRKDADLVISRYELELENKDAYLRLKRDGDKFYAEASYDGQTWQRYDEPIVVEFPAEVQVGVLAVNSSNEPFRCTLDNFKVFTLSNK